MSKVQNLMSLENQTLLQIFIHDLYLLFQISLFTWILTVCFERFPCFLVDSLSAVPYFMIPWNLLPVSDISMKIHYLLQISLNIFCLLLHISFFTWILTVCCSRFPWMFTSSPKSFIFPERLTTCSKCSKSESEEVKVAADTFLWTYLYRVPDISINL